MDRDQDGYRYREPKQSGNMPIILLLIVIAIGIVVGVVFLAKSNSEQVYQRELKEAMIEFNWLEKDYKRMMDDSLRAKKRGEEVDKDQEKARIDIIERQLELARKFPEIKKLMLQ